MQWNYRRKFCFAKGTQQLLIKSLELNEGVVNRAWYITHALTEMSCKAKKNYIPSILPPFFLYIPYHTYILK